jgi:hypothetical protein
VSAKYFVFFLEITNSKSRIAVIVWNPVSKSIFCLNLTNTAFKVIPDLRRVFAADESLYNLLVDGLNE